MSKVFHGLDYQGRHPEAAHAATGEGEEYDSMEGAGVVVTPVVIIALIAVIGFVTWVVK